MKIKETKAGDFIFTPEYGTLQVTRPDSEMFCAKSLTQNTVVKIPLDHDVTLLKEEDLKDGVPVELMSTSELREKLRVMARVKEERKSKKQKRNTLAEKEMNKMVEAILAGKIT